MAKKYKAILSVLLVVLIAVSVITVTGVIDINKMVTDSETPSAPETQITYRDIFASDTSCADILMKTDIPGLFYTMTFEGDVDFYEISGGKINPLEESGVMSLEISCSGQTLPADVHYVKKDGHTAGVGLFTNKNHEDVLLYSYAFFKLTDMFSAFDSRSELMLMVDIDSSRMYSEDKVYSESFYVYESGKTEHFLSENQRTVGADAKLRKDYKMFTPDILTQPDDRVLFFSSRYYNEKDNKTDILTSGGGGENVDNLKYITDVAGLKFWRSDKETKYLVNTDTGFALNSFDGENTTENIKTFAGELGTEYMTDGSMLLNIAAGDIYDVVSGKEYSLDYNAFDMNFTPDLFTVSENAKYCMVRGKNNLGKPAIGVYNFETGSFYTYIDEIFAHIASMNVLDDGTMILSIANDINGSSYSQLIGVAGKNLAGEAL